MPYVRCLPVDDSDQLVQNRAPLFASGRPMRGLEEFPRQALDDLVTADHRRTKMDSWAASGTSRVRTISAMRAISRGRRSANVPAIAIACSWPIVSVAASASRTAAPARGSRKGIDGCTSNSIRPSATMARAASGMVSPGAVAARRSATSRASSVGRRPPSSVLYVSQSISSGHAGRRGVPPPCGDRSRSASSQADARDPRAHGRRPHDRETRRRPPGTRAHRLPRG